MKNIFKHKRTHKKDRDHSRFKIKSKSDFEGHDKLKNSALMDYYMMGGY